MAIPPGQPGPPAPAEGDRMLIACEGGPGRSRLVRYPPPLEIDVPGGVYVLVDEGPPHAWRYRFVPGD